MKCSTSYGNAFKLKIPSLGLHVGICQVVVPHNRDNHTQHSPHSPEAEHFQSPEFGLLMLLQKGVRACNLEIVIGDYINITTGTHSSFPTTHH